MSRDKYDEDFQRDAVRLIYTSGKTQRQIASDLGVSAWLLSGWKKKFRHEFVVGGDLATSAEERIKALEKEVSVLRQERDILKKAMGITLNQ